MTVLLICALLLACGFEMINGFHDTANAVATVIYTRSMKPWVAVIWSGLCNTAGVLLGGTAVAMGIMKLLPPDLVVTSQIGVSLAMIFALLSAAIIWNFGTWYLGLPASSSHTLIGAILGIGLAHGWMMHASVASSINWGKAKEIGLALILSPLLGALLTGFLLIAVKKFLAADIYHQTPKEGQTPPWRVRILLMLTSSGVSLAHGSNDGQKGMGLIMLILITCLPAQFALKPGLTAGDFNSLKGAVAEIGETLKGDQHLIAGPATTESQKMKQPSQKIKISLLPKANAQTVEAKAAPATKVTPEVSEAENQSEHLAQLFAQTPSNILSGQRGQIRSEILKLDNNLSKIEKSDNSLVKTPAWKAIQSDRKLIKAATEFVPTWVIFMVAISLGFGTMVGWKRIVVTVGEKIGKSHLTYAQGASAEMVAMGTIGISAFAGLPVSTTHVLSSGIAGAMVAEKAGLQKQTVQHIILAWLLTLPASMVLSAGLFLIGMKIL